MPHGMLLQKNIKVAPNVASINDDVAYLSTHFESLMPFINFSNVFLDINCNVN